MYLLSEKPTFNAFVPPEPTTAPPAGPGLVSTYNFVLHHPHSGVHALGRPAHIFWYLSEQGCPRTEVCRDLANLKISLIQKFEFSFQDGKYPCVGPWSLVKPFQLQVLRRSLPCLHHSKIITLFQGWHSVGIHRFPAGCWRSTFPYIMEHCLPRLSVFPWALSRAFVTGPVGLFPLTPIFGVCFSLPSLYLLSFLGPFVEFCGQNF